MQSNQTVFQAKIKRRARTPVIMLPNTTQFEMIVDTGASGTVITQPIAAWMNRKVGLGGISIPLRSVGRFKMYR